MTKPADTIAPSSGVPGVAATRRSLLAGAAGVVGAAGIAVTAPANANGAAAGTTAGAAAGAPAVGAESEDGVLDVSFFNPGVVYGLEGEHLRIYPRNLCPDRSVSLSTDFSRSDATLIPINSPVAGTTTITVRARRGSVSAELGSFSVVISGTPVAPAAPLNIVCIGDSTTAQYDNNGAAVNELARRLTGAGVSIADSGAATGFPWTGPAMPASSNLGNILFRGTLGEAQVKHEGRSGWRSINYTDSATTSGKTNAFWDPVGLRFSLNHYVSHNGFGVAADPVNGIQPSGSNLLIVVGLGWNDVYRDDDSEGSAATAATNLAKLIDEIHTDMPDAQVLVMGLNPPPRVIFKGLRTQRYISQEEVFEIAIKGYGDAFRAVCDARTNADFHAIAPVFDPEIAYGVSTYTRSFRSSEKVQGAGDYVHSRPPGYAMWADAVFYWIVNKYCQ